MERKSEKKKKKIARVDTETCHIINFFFYNSPDLFEFFCTKILFVPHLRNLKKEVTP